MNFTKVLSIIILSTLLLSCSSKKKGEDTLLPVDDLYNQSMDKLEDKKYKKAIEGFEELERTYPYSKWAIKAQLMSAYSSFKNQEYPDAITTLDKFIALHPGNKDVSYAYYLKAMCYYEQITDITRDQSDTVLALNSLREVVARFPGTPYARDAQGKVDLVFDHLAGKEVEVGRFYLKQKKYIAAINRFKEVLDKYDTTSHTPEALHRLVEANMALGIREEAVRYAAVLGYNFPGSSWYEHSYKLVGGKDADIPPVSRTKKWLQYIKNPLKSFKKEPNLVDQIDKNIEPEKPSKPLPKAEPVGVDRGVKVDQLNN